MAPAPARNASLASAGRGTSRGADSRQAANRPVPQTPPDEERGWLIDYHILGPDRAGRCGSNPVPVRRPAHLSRAGLHPARILSRIVQPRTRYLAIRIEPCPAALERAPDRQEREHAMKLSPPCPAHQRGTPERTAH